MAGSRGVASQVVRPLSAQQIDNPQVRELLRKLQSSPGPDSVSQTLNTLGDLYEGRGRRNKPLSERDTWVVLNELLRLRKTQTPGARVHKSVQRSGQQVQEFLQSLLRDQRQKALQDENGVTRAERLKKVQALNELSVRAGVGDLLEIPLGKLQLDHLPEVILMRIASYVSLFAQQAARNEPQADSESGSVASGAADDPDPAMPDPARLQAVIALAELSPQARFELAGQRELALVETALLAADSRGRFKEILQGKRLLGAELKEGRIVQDLAPNVDRLYKAHKLRALTTAAGAVRNLRQWREQLRVCQSILQLAKGLEDEPLVLKAMIKAAENLPYSASQPLLEQIFTRCAGTAYEADLMLKLAGPFGSANDGAQVRRFLKQASGKRYEAQALAELVAGGAECLKLAEVQSCFDSAFSRAQDSSDGWSAMQALSSALQWLAQFDSDELTSTQGQEWLDNAFGKLWGHAAKQLGSEALPGPEVKLSGAMQTLDALIAASASETAGQGGAWLTQILDSKGTVALQQGLLQLLARNCKRFGPERLKLTQQVCERLAFSDAEADALASLARDINFDLDGCGHEAIVDIFALVLAQSEHLSADARKNVAKLLTGIFSDRSPGGGGAYTGPLDPARQWHCADLLLHSVRDEPWEMEIALALAEAPGCADMAARLRGRASGMEAECEILAALATKIGHPDNTDDHPVDAVEDSIRNASKKKGEGKVLTAVAGQFHYAPVAGERMRLLKKIVAAAEGLADEAEVLAVLAGQVSRLSRTDMVAAVRLLRERAAQPSEEGAEENVLSRLMRSLSSLNELQEDITAAPFTGLDADSDEGDDLTVSDQVFEDLLKQVQALFERTGDESGFARLLDGLSSMVKSLSGPSTKVDQLLALAPSDLSKAEVLPRLLLALGHGFLQSERFDTVFKAAEREGSVPLLQSLMQVLPQLRLDAVAVRKGVFDLLKAARNSPDETKLLVAAADGINQFSASDFDLKQDICLELLGRAKGSEGEDAVYLGLARQFGSLVWIPHPQAEPEEWDAADLSHRKAGQVLERLLDQAKEGKAEAQVQLALANAMPRSSSPTLRAWMLELQNRNESLPALDRLAFSSALVAPAWSS